MNSTVMNPNAKEFFPASWWDQEVAWKEAYDEKARRESEPNIDKFLAESAREDADHDYEAAHSAEDKALHLFVQHVYKRIDPERDHVIAAKIVSHLEHKGRGSRWCA